MINAQLNEGMNNNLLELKLRVKRTAAESIEVY